MKTISRSRSPPPKKSSGATGKERVQRRTIRNRFTRKECVIIQKYYSAGMGALVVLLCIQLLGTLSFTITQNFPPTSRIFSLSWHVSGNFGCSWESWRRFISSTKHATVIRIAGYSWKVYAQDVLSNVTERTA